MSDAARDRAITGRAVDHAASASNPTSAIAAPIPVKEVSSPGSKAARATKGRTTTSDGPRAQTKKLSQGLVAAACGRSSGAIFRGTTSGRAGSLTARPCLSSICRILRVLPPGFGKFGSQLTLPGGGRRDLLCCDGHGPAALGDALDRQAHLIGGSALLLMGGVHLASGFGHLLHQAEAALHLFDALLERHHRLAALGLGAFDDGRDLSGCGLGAVSQPSHLVCDDGEPPARVTGPRRFNRSVQGEKVGLVGDVVDQLEDALDLIDT